MKGQTNLPKINWKSLWIACFSNFFSMRDWTPITLSPSSKIMSLVIAFVLKKKPAARTSLSFASKNSKPCSVYI